MVDDEGITIRESLSGHVHTREQGSGLKTVAGYPHLRFSDVKHYKEALKFARKVGGEPLQSFKNAFDTLERFCVNGGTTAEVHPDFTKHGFYFREYGSDGRLAMDGGIILHGLGESFSVELSPKSGLHWSMHT